MRSSFAHLRVDLCHYGSGNGTIDILYGHTEVSDVSLLERVCSCRPHNISVSSKSMQPSKYTADVAHVFQQTFIGCHSGNKRFGYCLCFFFLYAS